MFVVDICWKTSESIPPLELNAQWILAMLTNKNSKELSVMILWDKGGWKCICTWSGLYSIKSTLKIKGYLSWCFSWQMSLKQRSLSELWLSWPKRENNVQLDITPRVFYEWLSATTTLNYSWMSQSDRVTNLVVVDKVIAMATILNMV